MDAGVAGFEDAQNTQCATFYGASCGLYRDLLLDLTTLYGSPAPPPPPLPPLGVTADVAELTPVRIFFAHGPLAATCRPRSIAAGRDRRARGEPYRRDRRRHLQSADADGEGGEILDASDDPR